MVEVLDQSSFYSDIKKFTRGDNSNSVPLHIRTGGSISPQGVISYLSTAHWAGLLTIKPN